jgi:hypothetical protein
MQRQSADESRADEMLRSQVIKMSNYLGVSRTMNKFNNNNNNKQTNKHLCGTMHMHDSADRIFTSPELAVEITRGVWFY